MRAKRAVRMPVVLTRREVGLLLAEMQGTPRLVASLPYGAGLRLLEAMRLRAKDLDLGRGEITIRDGKGQKDRATLLPALLREPLPAHLSRVAAQHRHALPRGGDAVALPDALALPRPRDRPTPAPPPARVGHPTGG